MIFIDLADESIRYGIASFVCNCLSASWNCRSASLLTQISSDRGLFGTAFMRRASTRATRSAASVLSPLLHWLRSELKRIQGGSYHVRVACRMNTKNAWIHLPPFYIYVLLTTPGLAVVCLRVLACLRVFVCLCLLVCVYLCASVFCACVCLSVCVCLCVQLCIIARTRTRTNTSTGITTNTGNATGTDASTSAKVVVVAVVVAVVILFMVLLVDDGERSEM